MDLPAPLVPAEVDLSDYEFMPLSVRRLRDSDLAADHTPEACWAAVLLWCAAWHQVPAGSIPDNNQWQAKQAGYVARGRIDPAWDKVREGALHGFVLCSDGRLYHPVVAEKARDAWLSKLNHRWKTECDRIKKHCNRHQVSLPRPSFEEWLSLGCPQGQPLPVTGDNDGCPEEIPRETTAQGQGEGQGQGQGYSEEGDAPARAREGNTFDVLDCPCEINREAWHQWVAHRRKRKKPISEQGARSQWEALATLDQAKQAQCIALSIRNDWQGLFPEKFSNAAANRLGRDPAQDRSAAGQVRAAAERDRQARA